MINCQGAGLDFLGLNKPLKLRSVASVHWQSTGTFQTQPALLRKLLVNGNVQSTTTPNSLWNLFCAASTAKFVISDHTPSFLHLRRHFPQMRGSSHKRQDLENQAETFQNLTESPNSCACHFANNFTLKSRLHIMSSTCIAITRTSHSSDLAIRLPFIWHRTVHSSYTLHQTGNS